jgi:hypothetical protein
MHHLSHHLSGVLACMLVIGFAGSAAARPVTGSTRTSVSYNGNRNTNINRNVNVNRDVNVNRNVNVHRDIDVDVDRGYHPVYPVYHPVARAAGAVATAAVVGAVVSTLPPSCVVTQAGGVTYQRCGATWYRPQYAGTSVSYVVVNPL